MKKLIVILSVLFCFVMFTEAQDKTASIATGSTLTENFSPRFSTDTLNATKTSFAFQVKSLQRDYAVNTAYVTLDSISEPNVSFYLSGSISGKDFTAFS